MLGNEVEFLTAHGEGQQWYLLNVTNVQKLMDVERSKFTMYEDGHIGPCTHAYVTEPGNNSEIFLVDGYFPNVFINEKAKSAIKKAGLSGKLLREYKNP